MSIKTLFITGLSSIFLAACGNGSDSIQNQWSGIERLDYNQAETIEKISQSVFDLANPDSGTINALLTSIDQVNQYIKSPSEHTTLVCNNGTIIQNPDNSITLNQCEAIVFLRPHTSDSSDLANKTGVNNLIYNPYAGLKRNKISGTVQILEQNNELYKQKIMAVKDFTIFFDKYTIIYNGDLDVKQQTIKDDFIDIYEIKNIKYSILSEKKEHYSLTDYRSKTIDSIKENNIKISQGTLAYERNNKIFSVNFDSELNFKGFIPQIRPKTAQINIEDTTNSKNSITLKDTSNGKALISAFANSKSVAGYPKTIDWTNFY